MQLLLLLAGVLAAAKAQDIPESDTCYSTEDITVQYTLWIGTDVDQSYTTDVSVRQFSTFYTVISAAAEQDPARFR
jgi:hypothetical protein